MTEQSPEFTQRVSEDQLRQVTIGEPNVVNSQITIVDYDSAWPEQFVEQARIIRDALGDHALRIEHAGSTSVPGLPAKPIIDIVLVVANSADESTYVPALEAAGYTLRIREPDWEEHRVLKSTNPDVNLHVFTDGSPEVERMLLMRDWMRAHPEDRDRYAAVKRDLAARTWKYVQNYADAKSDVVEEILVRAKQGSRTED
jgi:GrpB-like predicted nucleotidyltransferase (UPF0157 family)